jgi:hypothetical protein
MPETTTNPDPGQQEPKFAGDTKTGQSLLGPAERRFID